MTKESSLYNFIDSNLREIRWTAYSLGTIAIILILRRAKSTTKFQHACEIPDSYVLHNYRLHGHVMEVTPSGCLTVDHTPIMQLTSLLPQPKSHSGQLHIQIAGLDITPLGCDWLQSHCVGKHVWFTLMERRGDVLDCHVKLRKRSMWYISINKELVKQGFCAVRHFDKLPQSANYERLLIDLIALESKASRKSLGIWEDKSHRGRFRSKILYSKPWLFFDTFKKKIYGYFRRKKDGY